MKSTTTFVAAAVVSLTAFACGASPDAQQDDALVGEESAAQPVVREAQACVDRCDHAFGLCTDRCVQRTRQSSPCAPTCRQTLARCTRMCR
jgi:hypothetical protein